MRGLAGKVGIVTGGASGIGRAIARRLAEEGCQTAVFDRNGEGARNTAEEIRAAGGIAHAFEVDIIDGDRVESAVGGVVAALGTPWFLVNAAGWNAARAFLQTDQAQWKQIIDINLYGTLNMLHAVCKRMAAAGGGRVINIASDAGRTGAGDTVVYSACKGGVIAATKSLARELAPNILINVISPGMVDTPLLMKDIASDPRGAKWVEIVSRAIPLKRLGKPEDFAGLTALLISEDGAYITGQTISVSGGLTMV